MLTLLRGNTMRVLVTDLLDEVTGLPLDATALAGATGTLTIKSSSGTPLAGVDWPLTLGFRPADAEAGRPASFGAVLPHTMATADVETALGTVTIAAGGATATLVLRLRVLDRIAGDR